MKKLFTTTAILLIMACISSCNFGSSSSVTSTQFTVSSGQWVAGGSSGTSNFQYYYAHNMSSITSNTATNGAVLCYALLSTQWAALPYVETYNGYTRIYGYQFEAGTLYVTIKDSDLLTSPGGSITYKVVIVEQKNMHLLDGVNTNDYYAVSDALDLEK